MKTFGISNVQKSYKLGDGYIVQTKHAIYYIPQECSDSTNTIVYSHGAGGVGFQQFENYLGNHNVDAIVAIPIDRLSYNNVDDTMEMLNRDIERMHSNLGINNSNMYTIGHSSGSQSCLYFMARNIKENPNIGPQTCVLIDAKFDAEDVAGFVAGKPPYSSKDLERVKANGATVIGLEVGGSSKNNPAFNNYRLLGKAGVDVYVVGMKGMGNYSSNGPHVGICNYSINKGILKCLAGGKSVEDFLKSADCNVYHYENGNFKKVSASKLGDRLNAIIGSISNYDTNSGEYRSNVNFGDFSELSASLKTLDDLTTITNDQEYVVGAMNTIRAGIKNSSLLSNTGGVSCSSTTFVPTCAENFLHDYFAAILNLLDKLRMETEKAITVGTKLEESDEELAARAKAEQETIYVSVPSYSSIGSGVVASAVVPAAIATETITTNQTVLTDEERLAKLKPYSMNSLKNKNLCTKVYDITADDLNRLFDHWAHTTGNYNSPLRGTGEAWIKACDATGLDPLTLVGICGEETGRGGFKGMGWMNQKNFFGMRYIDPYGDGTGRSVKWAGDYDLFASVDDAVMASAKRIKNFYYNKYGGYSMAGLAQVGYGGGSKATAAERAHYSYMWASVMKESLDYITGTNGGK